MDLLEAGIKSGAIFLYASSSIISSINIRNVCEKTTQSTTIRSRSLKKEKKIRIASLKAMGTACVLFYVFGPDLQTALLN